MICWDRILGTGACCLTSFDSDTEVQTLDRVKCLQGNSQSS